MNLCIVTHGIEKKLSGDYAHDFIVGIRRNMTIDANSNTIFHSFNWSELVEERENYLINSILAGMNKKKIRSIIAQFGGDILWYNRTKKSDTLDTYHAIHTKMQREISEIVGQNGLADKIILIGHSWGSQVSLDACFEYTDIRKISVLITMGSPIAYQSGAFLNGGQPPDVELFLNFWNTYDPVSTILSRINDKWRSKVTDIEVKSWNPLNWLAIPAHIYYWKSPDVQKQIANLLNRI